MSKADRYERWTYEIILHKLNQLGNSDIITQCLECSDSLVSRSIRRFIRKRLSSALLLCLCSDTPTLLSGKIWDNWTSCINYPSAYPYSYFCSNKGTYGSRTISSITPILTPFLNYRIITLSRYWLFRRGTGRRNRSWGGCRWEGRKCACLSDVLPYDQRDGEDGYELEYHIDEFGGLVKRLKNMRWVE